MPFKMISLFPINMITDRPRGRDDLRTQRKERERERDSGGGGVCACWGEYHKRLPVHEISFF